MCGNIEGVTFEISRQIPGQNTFVTIDKSAFNYDYGDINLKDQKMSISTLCNGNKSLQIKFSVNGTKGQELNSIITTVEELGNGTEGKREYEGKAGAKLIFTNWKVVETPSFLEYMRSGLQISLVAAIDYTASNGDPRNKNSLHHIGGYDGMN